MKSIKTEVDYNNAIMKISELIDCEENSHDENELERISLLVWEYEEKAINNTPINRLEK